METILVLVVVNDYVDGYVGMGRRKVLLKQATINLTWRK